MRSRTTELTALALGVVIGLPVGYYGVDKLSYCVLTPHHDVANSGTPIRLMVIDVRRQDDSLVILLEDVDSQDRALFSILPLPRLNVDQSEEPRA